MKQTFAHLLVGFALISGLRAQTVEDYVAQGRSFLSKSNLHGAHQQFANALALAPGHAEANTFLAATRLLVLLDTPAVSNFLTQAGVPTSGRDLFNWTALPTVDTSMVPVLPNAFQSRNFIDLFRTNLLPELMASESNLSKVTNPGFILQLDAPDLTTETVSLDYADVLLLRSLLLGGAYGGFSALYWNYDADVQHLQWLRTNNLLSAENVLREYPRLLSVETTNYLQSATNAMHRAIDLYIQGSSLIRARPTNVFRMFNYDPEMAEDEDMFRTSLLELRASLAERVVPSLITNYSVFLGALISGSYSLRDFLPTIQSNSFILGSLPDPTLNGLIGGFSAEDIDAYLATGIDTIPSFAPALKLDAGLRLRVKTATGHGYVLQTSTNLNHWADEFGFFGDERGACFLDPSVNLDARRFYRVVERTGSMPPPLNDMFADAEAIPGLNVQVRSYTASATSEPFENSSGFGHSVWWNWTSPLSAEVAVVAPGSESPPISIFVGTSTIDLTRIAGGEGEVRFQAEAGQRYYISADSYYEGGEVRLTVTRPPMLLVSNPLDGSRFKAPANVVVSGFAWDTDGVAPKVSISCGRSLKLPKVGATFDFTLTNVAGGSYDLEVSATDQAGSTTWESIYFSVHPPNDDFVEAAVITGAPLALEGSLGGATSEPGEPDHGQGLGIPSIWWAWTASASGSVSIMADHVYGVAVYTGGVLTNLTEVALGQGENGLTVLTFDASAGTTYRVACVGYREERVALRFLPSAAPEVEIKSPMDGGEFWGPTNITLAADAFDKDGAITKLEFYNGKHLIGTCLTPPYSITWSNVQPECYYYIYAYAEDNTKVGRFSRPVFIQVLWPPPSNDFFAQSTPVSGSDATFGGTNRRASAEPGEPDHAGRAATASVWWSWASPTSGPVSLTCQSEGRWSSPRIAVYTGTSVNTLIRVASDSHAYQSLCALGFDSIAGQTYHICFDADYTETASLRLISSAHPQVAVTSPQAGISYMYPTNLTIFASAVDVDGTIWSVSFFVDGDLLDTVYSQPFAASWNPPSPGQFTIEAFAEDNMGARTYSKAVVVTVASPIPTNDMFRSPTLLTGGALVVTGANFMATQEVGEPTLFSAPEKSVWWVWQAPKSGLVTITTKGSSFDTILGLYTGYPLTSAMLVEKDDDGESNNDSKISFTAQAGVAYHIKVAGYGGSTGSITLGLTQP